MKKGFKNGQRKAPALKCAFFSHTSLSHTFFSSHLGSFSFFPPVFFLVSPFGKRWGNIFALHYLFPLAVKKTRSGGKGGTYGFLYFFSSLFLLFFFGESDNGSAVILYKILSERKSSRNNCSSKMILCQ